MYEYNDDTASNSDTTSRNVDLYLVVNQDEKNHGHFILDSFRNTQIQLYQFSSLSTTFVKVILFLWFYSKPQH